MEVGKSMIDHKWQLYDNMTIIWLYDTMEKNINTPKDQLNFAKDVSILQFDP